MRGHWTLDEDVLHLNHGSFGAVPLATQQVQQHLREEMERNPMAWFRARAERLAEVRASVAGFLGVPGPDIALVPNASSGVSTALRAIDPSPDQRLVVTDHVYGAVRFAVERTAATSGCAVEVVALPLAAADAEVVAALGSVMDARTAAVVVDQVTSPTAKVLPVAEIAALGRQRGIPVVVDGAHAPGLMDDPVTGDFWTGNLHKWPCAPRGTAVLYVAPDWQSRVPSPTVSWQESAGFPASFDIQGTVDDTGWFAAPTSLALLAELDFAGRRPGLSAMLDEGAEAIAGALGERVVDVGAAAPTMRLVSLPGGLLAGGGPVGAVQDRLARQTGVEVALVRWRDSAFMRVSAHLYNTPDDYRAAAGRYRQALRG
ncbi:MAG TPA: aminotransferase class V-fold PLP-dependent enzyme [Nocardioidaceae bacterium]|nr:aminotransferase class V-fold PLP-dependent enzyme [Nocardioidaceae bacterium]